MQTVKKYIRAYDKEVECIVIDVPALPSDKWGNESYDDCYKACRQWLVDNYNFSHYVAFNLTSAGFVEDDIVILECFPVKFHFFTQGDNQ